MMIELQWVVLGSLFVSIGALTAAALLLSEISRRKVAQREAAYWYKRCVEANEERNELFNELFGRYLPDIDTDPGRSEELN